MINLDDASMIFTLNGELLITNKGSELAFADYEIKNGKLTTFPLHSNSKRSLKLVGKSRESSVSLSTSLFRVYCPLDI